MPPQQSEVDQQHAWEEDWQSQHAKHPSEDTTATNASPAAAMEQLDPFEPVERRTMYVNCRV